MSNFYEVQNRAKTVRCSRIRSGEPGQAISVWRHLERRGYGGQAAAMRGEPNAIGIPTKKSPRYSVSAFFSDDEFEQNKAAIDLAFARILRAVTDTIRAIVIPSDGLGTGRAQLDKRAPRTFAYLQKRLAELTPE